MPDGTPDISGLYQADGGGANYGLEQKERDFLTPASRGVVIDPPDGILPYRDWARAERIDRYLPHRGYDDPTAHCFVAAGVPRSFYVPSPFHILQPPGYVVVLFERMAWRQIPLDGRDHIPDDIRLWNGDSVGRWEGDTLVVETRNMERQGMVERSRRRGHSRTDRRRTVHASGCRHHHIPGHGDRSHRLHGAMDHGSTIEPQGRTKSLRSRVSKTIRIWNI